MDISIENFNHLLIQKSYNMGKDLNANQEYFRAKL